MLTPSTDRNIRQAIGGRAVRDQLRGRGLHLAQAGSSSPGLPPEEGDDVLEFCDSSGTRTTPSVCWMWWTSPSSQWRTILLDVRGVRSQLPLRLLQLVRPLCPGAGHP